ncbi:MAG: hypothetical protein H7833_06670 [Magnetococcus sp. DMHC-1]
MMIRHHSLRHQLLWMGVAGNLSLLIFFKYTNFILDNLAFAVPIEFRVPYVLPPGISFFVFQKIAYLVDVARQDDVHETNFWNFGLFVAFFPQLVAGPIVHYGEIMPQFYQPRKFPDFNHITVGLIIFILGLFKKLIVADSLAEVADPIFALVDRGGPDPGFLLSWTGALAFTFQLYFDFSGYSDMAIGLALCFSIRLPLNFWSPYKARNIIEFWKCWHVTLSRFLQNYLYIPLGGNRHGPWRRYRNLMLTMLLGGLWHGAGWNFVFWGFLHGLYLTINHGWRHWRGSRVEFRFGGHVSRLLTFLCVVVAWVFFRAKTFSGAKTLLGGMFSWPTLFPDKFNGVAAENFLLAMGQSFPGGDPGHLWYLPAFMVLLYGITLMAPNTMQILGWERTAWSLDTTRFLEIPPVRNMLTPARKLILMIVSLLVGMQLYRPQVFLYFQF